MRTYPTSTSNQNVPTGVFLIAETSAMSGEIVTTYYADKEGYLWKVTDWISNKPNPAFPFEIHRLTSDCEQIFEFRWRQHYNVGLL